MSNGLNSLSLWGLQGPTLPHLFFFLVTLRLKIRRMLESKDIWGIKITKFSRRIVNMDFYGCNDIPLGSFLEKYCFRRSYMCPSNTCDTPMIDHERRFVHDTGCVHITLKEIDSLPDKNGHAILMWSSCSACKAVSIST